MANYNTYSYCCSANLGLKAYGMISIVLSHLFPDRQLRWRHRLRRDQRPHAEEPLLIGAEQNQPQSLHRHHASVKILHLVIQDGLRSFAGPTSAESPEKSYKPTTWDFSCCETFCPSLPTCWNFSWYLCCYWLKTFCVSSCIFTNEITGILKKTSIVFWCFCWPQKLWFEL